MTARSGPRTTRPGASGRACRSARVGGLAARSRLRFGSSSTYLDPAHGHFGLTEVFHGGVEGPLAVAWQLNPGRVGTGACRPTEGIGDVVAQGACPLAVEVRGVVEDVVGVSGIPSVEDDEAGEPASDVA